jgi:hypothetical protein
LGLSLGFDGMRPIHVALALGTNVVVKTAAMQSYRDDGHRPTCWPGAHLNGRKGLWNLQPRAGGVVVFLGQEACGAQETNAVSAAICESLRNVVWRREDGENRNLALRLEHGL